MKANLRLRAGAALLALLLGGCAQLPEYTRLPVVQHPSVNFNERRPSFVILHHTGNPDTRRALGTLSNPVAEVSAHYLVARDGTIYYLVDEMKRAWHAGDSWWGGPIDMNSASIGIELDNDGREPYAEQQIVVLLALLADIQQRYGIPAANFIGHGDIAPGRKVDPGVHFPWRRLAEQRLRPLVRSALRAGAAGPRRCNAARSLGLRRIQHRGRDQCVQPAFRRHRILAHDR